MKPREITIIPVLNGFVCRVDCQTVVFKDKDIMLSTLSNYYDNPAGVERQFVKDAINKTLSDNPCDPEPARNIACEVKRPY